MKKKIYLVYLDNDIGEVWLDENKKPLSWISSNDANWRDEYHNFIIEYLGGELVVLNLEISEKDYDKLCETADSVESVWKIIKKYVK